MQGNRCLNAVLALVLSLLAPALAAAQEPPVLTLDPGVAQHADIDGIYRAFSQAYRRLDAAALGRLYTEDALYLPPDRDVQRGRAAIEGVFAPWFAEVGEEGGSLAISFRILAREVAGGLGYDVGIYTLRTRGAGGEGGDAGKFVVVTRRGADGVWRFAVDGYSGIGGE